MTQWKKLGLIFKPPSDLDWMVSHAALPVAQHLGGDIFRVYFSGRDIDNRARIGCFDFDLISHSVLHVATKPLIDIGMIGAYDDSGVTSSWLVLNAGSEYHYFTGWSRGVSVPFYFYAGLAIRITSDDVPLKVSAAPILERNAVDPFLTASPCVLVEQNLWRMWYVSAARWEMIDNHPRHYYNIRYAESSDGIHWNRTGRVCIDFASVDEYAFARPCVLKDGNVYKMWYSWRGESYRIGYAESHDGLSWLRKDGEAGIDVSASGWDSEMIEYPFVFDHNGKRYMFYNGNAYGKTGIGLAVLG